MGNRSCPVAETQDGLYADFHSLRHYCITSLERSGVSPNMAQTLARHSDIRLTLGVYSDIGLHDPTAAIGALPGPPYQPQQPKRVGGHRPSEWAASGAHQRFGNASRTSAPTTTRCFD